MCTIMLYPETLPAEKRSVKDSRMAVDRLMEYDWKLSEDFTKEELRKLFLSDPPDWRSRGKDDYSALTEREKQLLAAEGYTLQESPSDEERRVRLSEDSGQSSAAARRRRMKAVLTEPPAIPAVDISPHREMRGWWQGTGKVYVWLGNMSFGNSDDKGFYYVRDQLSMFFMSTTAYAHPQLIVQKSKLRPDQIEYMERKCRETQEEIRTLQAAGD